MFLCIIDVMLYLDSVIVVCMVMVVVGVCSVELICLLMMFDVDSFCVEGDSSICVGDVCVESVFSEGSGCVRMVLDM